MSEEDALRAARTLRQYLTLFGGWGRDERTALAALDTIDAALASSRPEPHYVVRTTSKPSDPDDVRDECSCGYANSPEKVAAHIAALASSRPEPLDVAVRTVVAEMGYHPDEPAHPNTVRMWRETLRDRLGDKG